MVSTANHCPLGKEGINNQLCDTNSFLKI